MKIPDISLGLPAVVRELPRIKPDYSDRPKSVKELYERVKNNSQKDIQKCERIYG